jgi:sigma-54 specific flagellar transcriptional regulator A
VLVVEDDPSFVRVLRKQLTSFGCQVVAAEERGEAALRAAAALRPDVLLVDVHLPGPMDGVDVAESVRAELGIPVILMSAKDDEQTLSRVANVRASGFLVKPFPRNQVQCAIEVAVQARSLEHSLLPPPPPPDLLAGMPPAAPHARAAHSVWDTRRGTILGRDPRLVKALEIVKRVAGSSCTVLVTGESGTGKELFAAALHDASPRRDAPMVAVNCGAVPENLLESELFGHVRGAFTDAHTARRGIVASAEGGTLFLDEIGEMPLSMQVKFLRLLQSREYTPVGATRPLKCDVRVVAATHRDLEAEVARGCFREDLYHRINVVQIELPPLRERRDDIETFVAHFYARSAEHAKRSDLRGFSERALAALRAHDWPGNIRSLQNVIERAVLLAKGPLVELEDLPPQLRKVEEEPSSKAATAPPAREVVDLKTAVDEYRLRLIQSALKRAQFNKTRAATLLGINRTTLVEMMKRKGMSGV